MNVNKAECAIKIRLHLLSSLILTYTVSKTILSGFALNGLKSTFLYAFNIKYFIIDNFLSHLAGSARSRQSYAARPPATQQNGQADVNNDMKKPGIPVPGMTLALNSL